MAKSHLELPFGLFWGKLTLEDSCTFGKYHVNYTRETSVIKFLSNNSSTKTGLWQAEGFLAFLKNSKA
jgi:hypothetical protein